MQAGLIVIDENGGGDVHGVHEADPLLDPGGGQRGLNSRGQVEKRPPGGGMKGEFLTERLHFVFRESKYSKTTFD